MKPISIQTSKQCKNMQENSNFQPIPYYEYVSAGFPSPADDYMDKPIDLNEYLIKHPAATFLVRVEGESMLGAGIHPDDILIVDRSLTAKPNDIVIATLDADFTVKRYITVQGRHYLKPENPRYKVMEITDHPDCRIWGVVVYVIHRT